MRLVRKPLALCLLLIPLGATSCVTAHGPGWGRNDPCLAVDDVHPGVYIAALAFHVITAAVQAD